MKKFNEWLELREAAAYLDDKGKWNYGGELPKNARLSAFSSDEIESMLPREKATNDKVRLHDLRSDDERRRDFMNQREQWRIAIKDYIEKYPNAIFGYDDDEISKATGVPKAAVWGLRQDLKRIMK